MSSRKNLIAAALGIIGAMVLIATQTAGTKQPQAAYKLEGAWVIAVPGTPLVWNGVFAPEPSGRKAAIYGSLPVPIAADLFDPKVPYSDGSSDYVGEAVMTGPDTAKLMMIGHAIQKVVPSPTYPFYVEIPYAWVGTGELKFTAQGKIDCSFTLKYYPVGGDGLPDTSETPFFSMPGFAKMNRVGF